MESPTLEAPVQESAYPETDHGAGETNVTPQQFVFERPFLYPKQFAAIYDERRYSLIEATTKAGKTWGCIVWLLEQAMKGKSGHNFWWIAPVFPVAKIAFRRMKDCLPPNLFTKNEAELTVTLANGAVIWFKSADRPDNLYGEDVYAAVIDEATRCKEESWHAVRSTLTATRGPIRIIGNVKGRKNWAFKMARIAEAGSDTMGYHKITAADAVSGGILQASEIEDARKVLPAAVFKELYEAEPSDDEGNPFGFSAIAACVGPLSTNPPVAFGWDLARSIDWCVGVGIDREGCVCRVERFQMPWQETIKRIQAVSGRVRSLVDSTGVGDPILDALQRGNGVFEGYTFTSRSKQMLMEGLAVALQQKLIRFPDGVLVQELEAFEYEFTATGVRYSAPEGMHDDCVCALALAVHLWRSGATGPFKFSPIERRDAGARDGIRERGILI
jgi:hypothetical protein